MAKNTRHSTNVGGGPYRERCQGSSVGVGAVGAAGVRLRANRGTTRFHLPGTKGFLDTGPSV